MLVTSIYALCLNTTFIEQRELERHETLLRRANSNGISDSEDGNGGSGGLLYLPSGVGEFYLRRQEFPYDIGIWENLVQGMGSANVCIHSPTYTPRASFKQIPFSCIYISLPPYRPVLTRNAFL